MPYRRLFALTLSLLMPVWAYAEDGTVVTETLGEQIDRIIQEHTGGGYWGAALVARDGDVHLAKGYGFADYGQSPNTPKTLYEIASISKSITATAVLRLEMQGKLTTNDTIDQFFDSVPEDKRTVTVYQLLTHTSGVEPGSVLPYDDPATRDQLAAAIFAKPLTHEPGSGFQYSNSGYALLAAIVEIASGQTFEKYVRENIFEPAGMNDSGFIGDSQRANRPDSLRLNGGTPEASALNWHWGWGYRGMGGVVSTVYDLYRFDRALRDDTLLDADAKAKAYAQSSGGYGCGWLVDFSQFGGKRVQHSGGVAGFGALFVRHLDDDAVIIFLSNGRSNFFGPSQAIERQLLPGDMPIHLTVRFEPYELADEQMYRKETGTAWHVDRRGETVQLHLHDPEIDHDMATVRFSRKRARSLNTELEQIIERKPIIDGEVAAMTGGIFLRPYVLDESPLLLDEELDMRLMPQYRGTDARGQPIVDDRITFIVRDHQRSQWPILVMMNRSAAVMLAEMLEAVTAE